MEYDIYDKDGDNDNNYIGYMICLIVIVIQFWWSLCDSDNDNDEDSDYIIRYVTVMIMKMTTTDKTVIVQEWLHIDHSNSNHKDSNNCSNSDWQQLLVTAKQKDTFVILIRISVSPFHSFSL